MIGNTLHVVLLQSGQEVQQGHRSDLERLEQISGLEEEDKIDHSTATASSLFMISYLEDSVCGHS